MSASVHTIAVEPLRAAVRELMLGFGSAPGEIELVTDNLIGEGGGNVGRGSAYGVLLLLLCVGFIIWYLANNYRQERRS